VTWGDDHFDAMLEEHQEREAEAAYEREARGDFEARRPNAQPLTITFEELRIGDFMTAEDPADPDARWVEVGEPGDHNMKVTFRTPQPIGVGLHDRWTIERDPCLSVAVDALARQEPSS
jgi:hypothetical protein